MKAKPNDIIELEGHCWIHLEEKNKMNDKNGILQIKRDDLEKQLEKWGYKIQCTTGASS